MEAGVPIAKRYSLWPYNFASNGNVLKSRPDDGRAANRFELDGNGDGVKGLDLQRVLTFARRSRCR